VKVVLAVGGEVKDEDCSRHATDDKRL